jgi:hypothetical protein
METHAFLDYSNRFADGEFKTGAEATEAYVNVVAQFDPGKADDLIKNYSENEISQIANQGIKFQSTVSSLVQKNDFEGIRAFFDEQNGDATGVTLEIDSETGGIKMFQTGAEGEVIPIMDAPNAAEARAQLESVATYGNAASYAESLFARRKGEAEIGQTVASTAKIEKATEYQTIINDTAKYSEVLKQGNTAANTKVANAQVAKLKQEVDANKGLTWNDKQAQKSFDAFITGSAYADLALALEDNPGALELHTNRVKFGLGLIKPKPESFQGSQDQWIAMDDAGRAEF